MEDEGKSETKFHAKGLQGLLLELSSKQLAQCFKVPGLNPSLKLGHVEVAETEKVKKAF